MSVVETPRVHITHEVYDFMFLCINQPDAEKQPLQFVIVNHNGRAVRKGIIRGHIIQLRLSHLKEGKYHFSVSDGGNFYSRQQFVKRNCRHGEYTSLIF